MKILIAQTAGFCMGVKRAVDLALDNASQYSAGIYTVGPIIHNKQTIDMLKARGARILDESQSIPKSSPILIRAHGIPPDMQAKFAAKGHLIIDGTCPKVKTVHRVIEKYRSQGYDIVITGDKGHAEVIGLQSYAGEPGHLIHSVQDIESLPRLDRICLVSQTTFDNELFDVIARRIREKFTNSEIVVKKTICSATEKRQTETRELAGKADAIIVVGGKDSANTQRLVKIATERCPVVQHVETEKDINWDQIAQCGIIAITAGASTPNWMIKRIIDYLQYMEQSKQKTLRSFVKNAVNLCAHLNVFVALGAVAMYYVSCVLQQMPFHPQGALLAFLYFLSMYLWNSFASIEMTQHHGISRYRFYNAHRRLLLGLTSVIIVCILGISYLQNLKTFYLMLFATLAGSVYHMTIVPKALRKITRYSNLKDVPTSRDLFVSLAWAILLSLFPVILGKPLQFTPAMLFCFSWIFFMAFGRSLIFDLRDIEGDRIMGRETLVTIIGEKRAKLFILALLELFFIALLAYPVILVILTKTFHPVYLRALFQLPVLLYLYFLIKKLIAQNIRHSSLFNVLADGQFYIAAFLAWVGWIVLQ